MGGTVRIHPVQARGSESEEFCTALTVWRKSLLFNCNGFTVFHPATGRLAFRVENYHSDPKKELLLMDAAGNSVLTMTRKRLSLHNEWQAFLGDKSSGQKPLFTVIRRRRWCALAGDSSVAEIFVEGSIKQKKMKRHPDYQIEGSYANRSCAVYNTSRNIVVEMKRKQVSSEITLGGDVFSVIVQPGFDQAFVMGFVVILDQIASSSPKQRRQFWGYFFKPR
ncbi:hypothetical protein KI387_036771 [Taxus chinensis]|uniref:Uncharacterized protein n=1 Tax=Taxus chinensis TaxID=29808 RepID=A0AA38FR99_TAXCH|nr:hypothetical protein KI387_036771 [Taxus chinensis]